MASTEAGEISAKCYQDLGTGNKKSESLQSLTPLQERFDHQKAKKRKRKKRLSKYLPAIEMKAKNVSRTALDTMRLRTIRKIPSMGTFTWQHISEEIETQMSKIELEETGASVVTDMQEMHDTKNQSDSTSEHTNFKKGHRKRNMNNQEKRKHKKRAQEIIKSDGNVLFRDDSKTCLENEVQKSEYQAIHATKDGLTSNNTIRAGVQEDEEQSKGKNRNCPTRAYGRECNTSKTSERSLQSIDSHSQYVSEDITISIKRSMPYTIRKSTKRTGKKTNHVRFMVRFPPVNVSRKEPVARHPVGPESPQTTYRQVYTLPKLALPGNLKLKMLTVSDTRSSSNNMSEEERSVFRNSEPKEIVKNKRSQSAVFKRFREYYSKRPHVTVS